jgi:hypothetical protein
LAEVNKVIDWLAACQEGDGMVVITVRFILVFVDPVEDCINGWVLVSWNDCPLHFIEAGNILLLCHGSKFCCRELRHNDWISQE